MDAWKAGRCVYSSKQVWFWGGRKAIKLFCAWMFLFKYLNNDWGCITDTFGRGKHRSCRLYPSNRAFAPFYNLPYVNEKHFLRNWLLHTLQLMPAFFFFHGPVQSKVKGKCLVLVCELLWQAFTLPLLLLIFFLIWACKTEDWLLISGISRAFGSGP